MAWLKQYSELIIIALTVIGVVLAWLQLRKKEPLASRKIDGFQANSAVASGTANIPIAMHSEGNVVFNHSLSAPVGPQPTHIVPVQPERPLPNLMYTGSEQKPVYIGRWESEGICDPRTEEQRKDAVTALVLKFENRIVSERTIGRAMNVIAKMRFLLPHDNKIGERAIDYGIWLDSPCNSTEMKAGDTRELVLLCVIGDKLLTFRDKRTGNRDFDSEDFSYLIEAEISNFDRVEVTIIDQYSQANLSGMFKFWREGTSFYIRQLRLDE